MMIGDNIKAIRTRKKMSIYRLQKKTGLSYAYLHGLENGLHKNPSINVIIKISTALDVDIKDLVET